MTNNNLKVEINAEENQKYLNSAMDSIAGASLMIAGVEFYETRKKNRLKKIDELLSSAMNELGKLGAFVELL